MSFREIIEKMAKNGTVISSASDDAASDSDSTDYEPESKKSKLENGMDDGEVSLVEGTIPIRAATSVSVVNFSGDAPLAYSEGGSGSINFGETYSRSEDVAMAMGSQTQNFLTVADLVEQTLQASLDRPPHPQASMAQSLLSLNEPSVEPGSPCHVPRLSASDNTRTPWNPVEAGNNTPADDFPTIAREVVVRMVRSLSGLDSQSPSALVQIEDDQHYYNELEVASVLDINENPIEDGSSTSGVDDEVVRRSRSPLRVEPVVPPEETDNNFADNENVKSDGDSESTQHPTSDSNKGQTASTSEISEKDKKFLCNQCQGRKAGPYFRYCLRCFKIRRTWLPSRPASRRLKSRKTQQLRNNNSNSLNNSRTTRSSSTSEGEGVVDRVTPGSQQVPETAPPSAATSDSNTVRPCSFAQVLRSLPSIQLIDMNEEFLINDNNPNFNRLSLNSQPGNLTRMEFFAAPERRAGPPIRRTDTVPVTSEVDSQSQSQQTGPSSSQSQGFLYSINSQSTHCQSSSSLSQPLQASLSPPKNQNHGIVPALSSPCSICYVREKDAAFVHNKNAHLYCCHTCADKILKKNGKCPICRERVLRVVKIISV